MHACTLKRALSHTIHTHTHTHTQAPQTEAEYTDASTRLANAVPAPLEVSATDEGGHNLVLHMALRAARAISKGEEILVAYGFGSWGKPPADAG